MEAKPQQHIVLFPYMAQGHIIPFVALAKLLEQRHPNLAITFLSTPLNIQNLRPSFPSSSTILLRSLPFRSSDHGLPPDSENTDTLPLHHILHLFQASESLRPQFELFISELTRERGGHYPACIIADVFLGWTVEVAKELGISHATFTTCGALGTVAYFALWLTQPHIHTSSEHFGVPGFPDTFRLHRSQLSSYLRDATGSDPWSLFFKKQISHSLLSDAMLCNTVEGLEADFGLRLLRENTGLPVWPIGPLLPLDLANASHCHVGKRSGIDSEMLMAWLDSQEPASVLYVSFGSQNNIGAAQMMALAKGLEASGAAFIWVIRPPFGADLTGESFKPEWLPEGFAARMRESKRGLLVRKWAPQLEILSHPSTGAFLSHCGWNSTLESLSRGVPVIGWPLASDQFYDSILLEELGAGIELARGVMSDVEHEEVERVVRLVMGGHGKGKKEMREKAAACRETIRAAMREGGGDHETNLGSSVRAIDEFVATVVVTKKPGMEA